MEVCRADEPDTPLVTKKVSARSRLTTEIHWDGRNSKKQALPKGEYVLVCYAKGYRSNAIRVSLSIREGAAPEIPLQLTGPVMPERTISDEAMWEFMQQPSAVITIG